MMKKISVLLIVCLMSVVAQAGVGLIDDFGDISLAEYTLSVVNDGTGVKAVSFASPSGDVRVSKAADSGHEQVLFLRDDYTLGVGEKLVADVTQDGNSWDRDFGIAVGYTETPPSLGAGETGDVRTSYVEVCYRSNNYVMSYGHDTALGSLPSGEKAITDIDSLFIARLDTTTFEVGYIIGGTEYTDLTILWNYPTPLPAYVITTDTPGAAVGLYADVRATVALSPTGLDDLRIIPEPATIALLGLGGLLLRRKRA